MPAISMEILCSQGSLTNTSLCFFAIYIVFLCYIYLHTFPRINIYILKGFSHCEAHSTFTEIPGDLLHYSFFIVLCGLIMANNLKWSKSYPFCLNYFLRNLSLLLMVCFHTHKTKVFFISKNSGERQGSNEFLCNWQ